MFERLEDWPEYHYLFEDLRSNWQAIAEEARAGLVAGKYKSWHEKELYAGRWDVLGLIWQGREVERVSPAPVALSVVSAWLPGVCNAGFSLLRPGCRIQPHVGYTNEVIRCHLGLICPSDSQRCAIQVGEQIRGWAPGEILLFDDTQEHSAWNEGGEDRVVMIIDLVRPQGRQPWRLSAGHASRAREEGELA